jgi:hypothetical protein
MCFKEKVKFIGNHETNQVVQLNKIVKMSEESRVYLPTEKMAEVWKIAPMELRS